MLKKLFGFGQEAKVSQPLVQKIEHNTKLIKRRLGAGQLDSALDTIVGEMQEMFPGENFSDLMVRDPKETKQKFNGKKMPKRIRTCPRCGGNGVGGTCSWCGSSKTTSDTVSQPGQLKPHNTEKVTGPAVRLSESEPEYNIPGYNRRGQKLKLPNQ